MNTKEQIDSYIASKKNAWAETTMKSEKARLYACVTPLSAGSPSTLWAHLQTHKPYTRSTTWTRVVAFWGWRQAKGFAPVGPNPYTEWRLENAKAFKNVYTSRRIGLTYEEVKGIIETLPEDIKATASYILSNGLRWSEASQHGDAIVGKGGKVRPRFGEAFEGDGKLASYKRLRCALRNHGLKPHDLRKLFATRLAEGGRVGHADLLRILGWNSIQTAQRYLQPKKDTELSRIVREETRG
jgi:integrase